MDLPLGLLRGLCGPTKMAALAHCNPLSYLLLDMYHIEKLLCLESRQNLFKAAKMLAPYYQNCLGTYSGTPFHRSKSSRSIAAVDLSNVSSSCLVF